MAAIANGQSLKRLTSAGKALVTEEFLLSDSASAEPSAGQVEELSRSIDLTAFNNAVTRIIKRYDTCDASMDAEVAPELHQSLQLSRREASDRGLWHFLSVVERPDFVRHRWASKSGTSDERFLGDLVRNAFARLWWGAEMTCSAGNYSATKTLFGNQDLYEAVAGRLFRGYQPALLGILAKLGREKGDNIKATTKTFNQILTTVVLEDLDKEGVETLIEDILLKVKKK